MPMPLGFGQGDIGMGDRRGRRGPFQGGRGRTLHGSVLCEKWTLRARCHAASLTPWRPARQDSDIVARKMARQWGTARARGEYGSCEPSDCVRRSSFSAAEGRSTIIVGTTRRLKMTRFESRSRR